MVFIKNQNKRKSELYIFLLSCIVRLYGLIKWPHTNMRYHSVKDGAHISSLTFLSPDFCLAPGGYITCDLFVPQFVCH